MIAARTKPQIHVYANVRSQSDSDHPCSFEPNHGGQLDVPLIHCCLRVGYTLDSRPYLYDINIAYTAPFLWHGRHPGTPFLWGLWAYFRLPSIAHRTRSLISD